MLNKHFMLACIYLSHQDPKATKPEDWDEVEKIDDPAAKKPDGWDDIPATMPDANAKKPEVSITLPV